MKTKGDIEAKAKSLVKTNPDEALKLYQEIWETYPDQFNEWDAFYAINAMRQTKSYNLHWAKQLAEMFKNDRVSNLYGWLIFDKCVKEKTITEIKQNEEFIQSLIILTPQKNLKQDNTHPCPTTISILKLCDAYTENPFNAKKINDILSGLDYNLLSNESKNIDTQERGKVELPSDLEKYFSLKTKALLKLAEFHTCIKYCNQALTLIKKFHHNNDLWFKMRIALSEEGLGNYKKSEELFEELLNSKAGHDKWFLYKDIAEIYFEQNNYEKAWKYAIDATFHGNEPHFLIGLYLLQARILFKLNRIAEGKILAELIAAIIKEQQWNEKTEYSKLFAYYKIDKTAIPSLNELMKQAKLFWRNERYKNKTRNVGTIISIHKNGKIGRIKDKSNNLIEFHKKNLVDKMNSIENLKGAIVEFFEMESYGGKKIAEDIIIIEKPQSPQSDNLIGKTFDGTVKNVTDFGIFILLQDTLTGLLHKNSLPNHLKNNFRKMFIQGMKVKVKVDKATEKGLQLSLVNSL